MTDASASTGDYQRLRERLHELKLTAAAEMLPTILDRARDRELSHTRFLDDLLEVEVETSRRRRNEALERFAALPGPWRIDDYDFEAQPGVDPKIVGELATLRFLEDATNVIFIGPPGVGKTMLAAALGRAAIDAGYRTHYTTAADLAGRCRKAALAGKWEATMRFYTGPRILIIDELGYLPLPAEAASALFQVISARYGKGSIVLTTNMKIGSRWGEIFADTTIAAAMLDRLLHKSVVCQIDGPSYRMRQYQARSEKARKTVANEHNNHTQ